jgi:hypothetical protein
MRNIPEYLNLQQYLRENLKPRKISKTFNLLLFSHKLKRPTNALYFHMYSLMSLHMFQLYQAIIRGSKADGLEKLKHV